jgi:hypothetical protein
LSKDDRRGRQSYRSNSHAWQQQMKSLWGLFTTTPRPRALSNNTLLLPSPLSLTSYTRCTNTQGLPFDHFELLFDVGEKRNLKRPVYQLLTKTENLKFVLAFILFNTNFVLFGRFSYMKI